MAYVGLQEQIDKNNRKSILLLIAFPVLLLLMVFMIAVVINGDSPTFTDDFISIIPFVFIGVVVWFLIAYLFNTQMINLTTHSETLTRKDNMRVYNLTENLCMSVGMTMPKLRIINSNGLNAFASGINEKSYTVTLTSGIIESLDDEELEGVIAHELTHIRNKDVRLLIISIIFVGIFSYTMQIAFRALFNGGGSSRRNGKNDKGGKVYILLAILAITALAYFFSFLFKMALSRKREYLADSGAVEMTKNPEGLARALEKIAKNSIISEVKNKDVQQMYIEHSSENSDDFFTGLNGIFATHPPIEKRIAFLRNI
ncbi:MAG TPA: M48 family metallopeptidase [Chitinophagaceae bacterium]|nr:M48 family metallopeptidase [Chitinophagaceae bacterium]